MEDVMILKFRFWSAIVGIPLYTKRVRARGSWLSEITNAVGLWSRTQNLVVIKGVQGRGCQNKGNRLRNSVSREVNSIRLLTNVSGS